MIHKLIFLPGSIYLVHINFFRWNYYIYNLLIDFHTYQGPNYYLAPTGGCLKNNKFSQIFLGDPEKFYNNNMESINKLLKRWQNMKK